MKFLGIPFVWAIQDAVVFAAAVVILYFIIRNEERPGQVFLEFSCFVFLYAAVYENIGASVVNFYGYGKSLIMIGDCPLSVPVLEYLVLYSALRTFETMRVPVWTRPILVGFFGMLQDLSLDPLAVRQTFEQGGKALGRWTWNYEPGAVLLSGIPVFNFPGWMLILCWGSAAILLGRAWFKRSGERPLVGILYPVLASLCALIVLASPLSQFLLWLAPFYKRGDRIEWFLFAAYMLFSLFILVFLWRGRMSRALSLKKDYPVFLVPVVFHLSDLVFALIGGFHEILWVQLAATGAQFLIIGFVYRAGRKAVFDEI